MRKKLPSFLDSLLPRSLIDVEHLWCLCFRLVSHKDIPHTNKMFFQVCMKYVTLQTRIHKTVNCQVLRTSSFYKVKVLKIFFLCEYGKCYESEAAQSK